MKKILRTLMLAAMMLPLVSHAQTMNLTVADGTSTNSYVPLYGNYMDDPTGTQSIYPASMLTDLVGENILGLQYYVSSGSSSGWGNNKSLTIKMMVVADSALASGYADVANATTVYNGTISASDVTSTGYAVEFTTPFVYTGGNLLVAFQVNVDDIGGYTNINWTGMSMTYAASRYGSGSSSYSFSASAGSTQFFLPKTTFVYGAAPTCFKVQGQTASNVTASSVTLSWTDTVNSGATYTIYNMADTTVVASNLSGTSYTVTDLDANTDYVFGIETDCGADGVANGYAVVSVRTACSSEALPFSESFAATLSNNPCWAGANILYTDSVQVSMGANSDWTYVSSVSNGIEAGHYRVNIYGTSCTKWMITPMIDLGDASNPLLSFDAAFTKYSGTGAATGFESNATQKFMVLVSTNGGTTWTVASDIALTSIASASYVPQFVDLSAYAGETVRIAFYAQSTVTGGDNNLHLDNISVSESTGEICYPTTGLTVSNITATSATVTWNSSTVGNYVLYIMNDSSSYMYTDTVANLNTLQPNTEYTVGVTVDCPSGESPMITTIFRTDCDAEALPFSETFDATLANDPCWRGASIVYTDSVQVSMGANSNWTYVSSVSNGIEAGHYRVNIYGTSCYKWLITPTIDFTTASSPLLSFDAVFTKYSGTGAATGFESNTSQKFMVLVSTNGGTTWSQAADISLSAIAGEAYATQYVDLSAYAGENVRIAFYAQSTVTGGDNNLHLDNINVSESTGSICYPVTNLAVSNITTDGATLTWVGTADGYTIYDMSDTSVYQYAPDTTVDLYALDPMTSYTFGVAANCGSDESEIRTISFNTACTAVDLPYTETFDATSGSRTCWSLECSNTNNIGGSNGAGFETVNGREVMRFSSYSYASDYNQYGFSPLMNVSSSATNLQVTVVYATYGSNDQLSFGYVTATDTVWDPTEYTTTGSSDWQTQTFVIPATATQLAAHYYGDCSYYAWIDSVVVTEMSGDYCAPVTGLTVDSVSSSSISLSWNSDGTDFTVVNMADGTVAATTTDTYVTINGLTASTAYTFGVVNNCPTVNSDTVTIAAATQCENMCTLTVAAVDTYGDGWTSSYIDFVQNGVSVAQFSMADQFEQYTEITETAQVSVCSGSALTLNWVSMSSYDDEASFTILNASGDTLYSADDASMLSNPFLTVADPCANDIVILPDSMQVTIAVNDATMGTTIPAPGVHYFYEGDTASIVAVPNTGYHLTGWTFTMTYDGQTIYNDTTVNMPVNDFFDLFSNTWVVEAGDDVYSFTVTANFAAGATTPDTVTVNITVSNPAEGTTNPAPGTHYFTNGDTLSVVALPAMGYSVAGWYVQVINPDGDTIIDQMAPIAEVDVFMLFDSPITANAIYNGYIFNVEPMFEGSGVGPGENDSLVIVTAVNDATMGTILPAPGTHVFHAGDTFSVYAIPNDGYYVESWTIRAEAYGQVYIDTTMDLPMNVIFPHDTADYYLGITYYFTANFAQGSSQFSDSSVVVTTSVNDATMGTIDPAPGTHNYYAGDVINFTITPNEGYHVETITVMSSHPLFGTFDTVYTSLEDFEQEMDSTVMLVEEQIYGLTINVSVVFAADGGHTEGIDDVESDSFTVSATNGTVVVLGAEGEQVSLYDVNGRLMSRKDNAAERTEFRVSNSGVYLVKVGNAAAKRVVVIR